MSSDLVVERVYNHSIARVWGAITDPACMQRWLGLTGFAPTVGNVFTVSVPGDLQGTIVGEVLEVNAPGLIRMFWRGGAVKSQVCIELAEANGATRLRMTQSDFGAADQGAMASIWAPLWGLMFDEGLPSALSTAVVVSTVPTGAGGSPVAAVIIAVVALLGLGGALCAVGAAGGWSPSDVAGSSAIEAQPVGGESALDSSQPVRARGDEIASADSKDRSHNDYTPFPTTSSGPVGVRRGATSAGVDYFDETLPTTMNPLLARTMVDLRSHELVFDRLYIRSAFNNEMQSRVVDTDAIIDAGRGLRVTLKEGVKWHDGQPLTAKDLCFTVHALLDPRT
ncbi:MAG: hypothetical protein ACI9MC_000649, partial [Kiritimatiellia bacterium]